MSKIGKNIQKIRKVKKLSQTAFGELFDLSRTSVGAYEEGRAEPKTDTLIQIAKYFGLSIDALLTRTIAVNDLYGLNKYDDKYLVASLGDSKISNNIIVLNDAVVPYIEHIGDQEFLNNLPTCNLPFIQQENYRVFQYQQQYYVCIKDFSKNQKNACLVVKQQGIEIYNHLVDDNSALEIWSIYAILSVSDSLLHLSDDRLTRLENELSELKDIVYRNLN